MATATADKAKQAPHYWAGHQCTKSGEHTVHECACGEKGKAVTSDDLWPLDEQGRGFNAACRPEADEA